MWHPTLPHKIIPIAYIACITCNFLIKVNVLIFYTFDPRTESMIWRQSEWRATAWRHAMAFSFVSNVWLGLYHRHVKFQYAMCHGSRDIQHTIHLVLFLIIQLRCQLCSETLPYSQPIGQPTPLFFSQVHPFLKKRIYFYTACIEKKTIIIHFCELL